MSVKINLDELKKALEEDSHEILIYPAGNAFNPSIDTDKIMQIVRDVAAGKYKEEEVSLLNREPERFQFIEDAFKDYDLLHIWNHEKDWVEEKQLLEAERLWENRDGALSSVYGVIINHFGFEED